ncbi:hypothetical protein KSP40_PGU019143 [Platanthera guangdongensis]|uniref:Uncharacterized protein n=1 Tax=Platanthera guangdongensis TaxID=2320717 RepID=A0ABR2N481_9ASPA
MENQATVQNKGTQRHRLMLCNTPRMRGDEKLSYGRNGMGSCCRQGTSDSGSGSATENGVTAVDNRKACRSRACSRNRISRTSAICIAGSPGSRFRATHRVTRLRHASRCRPVASSIDVPPAGGSTSPPTAKAAASLNPLLCRADPSSSDIHVPPSPIRRSRAASAGIRNPRLLFLHPISRGSRRSSSFLPIRRRTAADAIYSRLEITDYKNAEPTLLITSDIVYFYQIPDEVIQSLIDEGIVFNVAGGLLLEHPLILPLVEALIGTSDSVMGLPKALTERLIQEALDAEIS